MLQYQLERIILCIGDIIIDVLTGACGTLIARRHHIDIEADDVYLWEIKWFDTPSPKHKPFPVREESELKLSIVAGTYILHSISGETYERMFV